MEGTKVDDIVFKNEMFDLHSSAGNVQCKVAVGSFGKRSNLDVKWKRKFILQKTQQTEQLYWCQIPC
jgi:hypothetical protein